jgi:hypothetical protein
MRLRAPFAASRWVQRPEWLWGSLAAAAVCLLAFGVNAAVAEVRPGGAWGRTYGALAALLMVGAALLSVRRRTMHLGLGRAQDWVQFHVYGGTLSLLLVLLHAGFRWPPGGLARWLLVLTTWVAASGFAGIALRKWIPRLLTSGLRLEVLYERIPELAGEVRDRAAALAATSPALVQDFYRRRLAPDLARPRVRLLYFLDITGGIEGRLREFSFLRRLLAAGEQAQLDDLASLYRTKLELDAHFTLQKALRGWLYGHVPVSFVLLLLVAVHVFAALYY